jgi:hypothetical protein
MRLEALADSTGPNLIGGSALNTVDPGVFGATIAGGGFSSFSNHISSSLSAIGGGNVNSIGINANGSTIAGGVQNTVQANATESTIGGGINNTNTGPLATVPGGDQNVAGTNSFAAGHRAKAVHTGAFVWADSQNTDFSSTATNQFNVRANGGARFVTAGAGMTLDGPLSLPDPATIYSGGAPILTAASSGHYNFFAGYYAGNSTVTGNGNTGVGTAALLGNTSGAANTAIGGNALEYNTGGSGNTAVGYLALEPTGTGNNNTAIGAQALDQLFGGTNNIALGFQAGQNLFANESGNIDIGNLGVDGENNTIRIGSSQTQTYLAGVINGNGFAINGSQAGGIGSPLALIQNNNTTGNTSPALRIIGYGNSPQGVLSVSSAGTGLLAQFGNGNSFVADITTNGVIDATGFNGGTLRVGDFFSTTFTNIQAGQAIMPSSSTVLTNFTVTFPHAFSSTPKVIASISGDPGFPTAADTFVMSIRALTSTSGFTVNVMRVDTAGGWSQQLRINWQAWQ